MSYNSERFLPNMTKPGLIQEVLTLDPSLEEKVLKRMDTQALSHLITSLRRELKQPSPDPEPLDSMLISTAEKDGGGQLLPHRAGSTSPHWFNRYNTGKRQHSSSS